MQINKLVRHICFTIAILNLPIIAIADNTGFKITNIDNAKGSFKLEVYYDPDNFNNCNIHNRNIEMIAVIDDFKHEQSYQAPLTSNGRGCALATHGRAWFHTYVHNTPECEIQIFHADSREYYYHFDRARASLACKYEGLCVDGFEYNHKNRHLSTPGTPEYDAFEKVCLPYEL